KDGHEFNLAHARKAVALVGAQMITVSQELSNISINRLETDIRIKVFTILRATQQTLDRMAAYTISLDAGEELILKSRIYRLYKLIVLLREALKESDIDNSNLQRFVQLSLRNTKLLESSFNNIREVVNERSVLRTYPFMKTFYILHPKYWWQYLRLLFNFNSFTVKYAVRTATASAIAMFIYKWWNIDHGYWIPFTVLILMQTYFGATIKKARDRILGTLAGGLVAGLFLKLPTGLYLQEALLFLSFIPMIIYLRKRYSWAVFFITINLILLFSINREISDSLILIRGLSTIAGAGIAIVAGFALLPTWDKNLLPIHLAEAIKRNHHYFLATFFPNDADVNWTKHKRLAESGNNNAFDSFTRYMQEPGFRKKPYAIFYQILTHNIRITRELNNIRLEQDSDSNLETNIDTVRQQERINETLDWFNKNTAVLKQLDPNIISPTIHTDSTTITLSAQQEIYLEKMLIELKAMNEDLLILAEKLPRIMRL
ncbi:MAG: FUSC family protein, partial [Chitinophagaceae bacterium]|nr:FUSC family protein [Chitinophagaceae bacterium]